MKRDVGSDEHEVFSTCQAPSDSSIHNYLLWNKKLGHPSFSNNIKFIQCNGILVYSIDKTLCFCDSYQLAKAHKLTFLSSHTRSDYAFALLYLDLWVSP